LLLTVRGSTVELGLELVAEGGSGVGEVRLLLGRHALHVETVEGIIQSGRGEGAGRSSALESGEGDRKVRRKAGAND
jgi:hypothetical protein